MTEAMSRREIEDILSSIRKLVAHDPAGAFSPVPRAERDAQGLGKLVLTSALRVSEDPAPAAPERTPPTATAPEPEAEPDTAAAWPTEDMLTEHPSTPVARDNAFGHATLPDVESPASLLSRITRSAATPTPPAAPEAPIAAGSAGNIDAAPLTADQPETPPVDLAPLADHAAVVDVQDWLDDADIPLPVDAPSDQADTTAADTIADASDMVLEETLARLEAMLSGQSPLPESAPFAAEAPVMDAPEEPAASEPAPADDTAMIDEAMLYQLVANIVRQELQGELGEKITRAIRKLVRAEVARELQLRNQ
jgi:hypothetical protein